MANETGDFLGRSPLRVHHTDASSVVIDMICRSNSAIAGILLDPSVHTRSVLYCRILARLRREEPRYVFGRLCSGGSEWRTQLSLIGSLGFSLPAIAERKAQWRA